MLSSKAKSFIELSNIKKTTIDRLFLLADQFSSGAIHLESLKGFGKTGALLFFEPSTRTRLSFQTASARLGIQPILIEGKAGSSLEKGETLEDTVLNVDAMSPSFLVIRCGDELDLHDLSQKVKSPILNAGWGKRGHPSQALLDAYTIYRKFGTCKGQKLLIVGDIIHSRVASSHFELARVLGYEVALCGPPGFLPEGSSYKVFSNLSQGLQWANVAMALRVQLERHSRQHSLQEYRSSYGFTMNHLKELAPQGLIFHPGPINQGVELDREVLSDPRAQILEQVSNGVLIRQALIYHTLSEELFS